MDGPTAHREPLNPLAYPYDELAALFRRRYGKSTWYSGALFQTVYREGHTDVRGHEHFRQNPALARRVMEDFRLELPELAGLREDGRVSKLGLRLGDGQRIESVIIPMFTHTTLCLSSQVGCGRGCAFCRTARLGLVRNLGPGEIVGQVLAARRLLARVSARVPRPEVGTKEPAVSADARVPRPGAGMQAPAAQPPWASPPPDARALPAPPDTAQPAPVPPAPARPAPAQKPGENLVLMGMGEPLDNLEAVLAAIDIASDPRGLNIAKSRICLSTCGQVAGLRRLTGLAAARREKGYHTLHLAVSLNAPNDRLRSALMPVNRIWPMGELKEALREWCRGSSRDSLSVEYVLIPGVNSGREHALELAAWLADLRSAVHLIPCNPGPGSPFARPTLRELEAFFRWLVEAGQFTLVRATRGADIQAACGQLGGGQISGGDAR